MTVPGSPASVLAAVLRADAAHPYDASNPRQRRLATFSSYPSFPYLPSLTTDEVFLPQNAVLDANLSVTGTFTSQGWGTAGIATVTASYIPSPADAVILASAAIAPLTITLPDATQPGFVAGQRYTIKKTDATANAVTIAASAGQKIDGASTQTLTTGNTETSVVFAGANWWVWSGITTATVVPGGAASGDLGGTYPSPTVTATHLTAALPVNQGGTGLAAAGSAGQTLTTAFAGGLAWANAPVDWLNVVTGYGADPTGVADSATAISNALTAAAPGQVVYLPAGTYKTLSPLVIPQGVSLVGPAGTGATQSGDGSNLDLGATIKPGATWANGGLPISGAISFINGNGTSNTPLHRMAVVDVWIDGASAPASVDAVAAWGAMQAVLLCRVGINHATGRGVGLYTNTNFGSANFPDGFQLDTVLAQACTSHGFGGNFVDTTFDNCHAQSNGGDGFSLTGGNNRLTNCRSDLNVNGFTFDAFGGGGGFNDPVAVLVNCGTQRNSHNGLNAVNTSAPGTSARAPVILSGCTFDADGANGGVGGGGFAGMFASGSVEVAATGTSVLCGTVDVASPGCPQYAIATAAAGTGPGKPVLVQVNGGILNAASAIINDAAPAQSLRVSPYTAAYAGGPFYGNPLLPVWTADSLDRLFATFEQPAGTKAATTTRGSVTNGTGTTLTSGTLTVRAIGLPAGVTVSGATFYTGNTAFATLTHGWYALLDSSMKVVAVTADTTAMLTAANTVYPLSFAAAAVTSYSGIYYLGLCVAATTMGNIASAPALITGIAGTSPALCGTSSTAQTTPPAVGTTMAAVSSSGVFNFYGLVS